MADRLPVETSAEPSPSLSALVGGIVSDLQQLIHQEVQLARSEIKQEWDKARRAAGSMAAGAGLLLLGVFLLCFMCVYLIHLAGVPVWGAFGIVGGALAIIGLVLAGMGYALASRVNVIPPQTAETLRETMPWIRNPR
jgi:hypothetical protein